MNTEPVFEPCRDYRERVIPGRFACGVKVGSVEVVGFLTALPEGSPFAWKASVEAEDEIVWDSQLIRETSVSVAVGALDRKGAEEWAQRTIRQVAAFFEAINRPEQGEECSL